MKRLTALLLACLMIIAMAGLFTGCSEASTTADKIKNGETLKIGIIQFLAHPSLDNCYKGIIQGLDESGIKYEADLQIGSAATPDQDCANYAKNMVAANYDMIIAIATPAAAAAFTATADTNIPVIFSAVSDPEAAKLVKSNDKPGDNCTGTSDVLDLAAQLSLIKAMQPDVKKIGVLYTSSETNSLSNLARFQTLCSDAGIELIAKAVQSASDVPSAAADLAPQVDCINNFTDNNVVNNLGAVLSAAETNNIPVYGSEEEQVKNGCLASVSIDYVALGKVTGQMAVDVLKGSPASEMAVKTITDATPVVNTDVLAALGMTMPDAYADAAATVTTNK